MSKVDLSEFEALSKPRRKPCAVGEAAASLSAEERAQLAAACDVKTGAITVAAIGEWLKRRDRKVSHSAIVSHRRETCSCHDER